MDRRVRSRQPNLGDSYGDNSRSGENINLKKKAAALGVATLAVVGLGTGCSSADKLSNVAGGGGGVPYGKECIDRSMKDMPSYETLAEYGDDTGFIHQEIGPHGEVTREQAIATMIRLDTVSAYRDDGIDFDIVFPTVDNYQATPEQISNLQESYRLLTTNSDFYKANPDNPTYPTITVHPYGSEAGFKRGDGIMGDGVDACVAWEEQSYNDTKTTY